MFLNTNELGYEFDDIFPAKLTGVSPDGGYEWIAQRGNGQQDKLEDAELRGGNALEINLNTVTTFPVFVWMRQRTAEDFEFIYPTPVGTMQQLIGLCPPTGLTLTRTGDGAASFPLLVDDAFTDTDDRPLENHFNFATNATNSAWSTLTSGFVIESNTLTYAAVDSDYGVLDALTTNYVVELTGVSDDEIGLVFRYQDANNYYYVSWENDGTGVYAGFFAGSPSVLNTFSWSADASPHAFKVIVSDTTLETYIDGVLQDTFTVSITEGSSVGLLASGNATFTDFTVDVVQATYGFRVTAKDAIGQETGFSSEVTLAAAYPLTPINSVMAHWNSVSAAAQYGVYGRLAGGELHLYDTPATSYRDEGFEVASGEPGSFDGSQLLIKEWCGQSLSPFVIEDASGDVLFEVQADGTVVGDFLDVGETAGPTYTSVNNIQFNSTSFLVTNPSPGVVEVDFTGSLSGCMECSSGALIVTDLEVNNDLTVLGQTIVHDFTFNDTVSYNPTSVTWNTQQNNYSVTTTNWLKADLTGATSVTGFVAPSPTQQQFFYITNTGSYPLSLPNNSTSSTSGNRVLTPDGSTAILYPNQTGYLYYDPLVNYWRYQSISAISSLALDMPAEFNVTGNPLLASGDLGVTWANESANKVLAGPTTGSPGTPSFRSLVTADMPSGTGTVTHTGTLTSGQLIIGNGSADVTTGNLSGDVTTSGSTVTTLATVATAGTYEKVTINAKGLVTSGTTLSPTDLGTTPISLSFGGTPTLGIVPAWYKVTVTYTDLAAAATSGNNALFSLPANGVIQDGIINHTAAFVTAPPAQYLVSVGKTATGQIVQARTVNGAPADPPTVAGGITTAPYCYSIQGAAATTIKVYWAVSGVNSNTATSGSADFYLLMSSV